MRLILKPVCGAVTLDAQLGVDPERLVDDHRAFPCMLMFESQRDVALKEAVRKADRVELRTTLCHLALVDNVGQHKRPEGQQRVRKVADERVEMLTICELLPPRRRIDSPMVGQCPRDVEQISSLDLGVVPVAGSDLTEVLLFEPQEIPSE